MTSPELPSKSLTRGVATGLLLMAVFTAVWATNTLFGWARPAAITASLFGVGAAIVFIIQSIRLIRASRSLPAPGASQSVGSPGMMRSGRVFGLIFGAEGVLIGIAAGVLGSTGLDQFILPAIAVIVGLHFYPMAWVFQRRIDVWLATWTTLVGVAGIVAIAVDGSQPLLVWAWVGAGVAAATATYGIYMSLYASRLLRKVVPGSLAAS